MTIANLRIIKKKHIYTLSSSVGKKGIQLLMAASVGSIPLTAQCTEHGNEHYPIGVLTVQPAILPPPGGTEYYTYNAYIQGGDFIDNNGGVSQEQKKFHLAIYATAHRIIHTWHTTLGPFNLSSGVTLNAFKTTLRSNGETFHRTGIADPSFQPLWLTYNTPSFHVLMGSNIWVPWGAYDKKDPASPGLNYWTFAPEFAVTWLPTPSVELSADWVTQFNTRNHATHYHSGSDTNLDYLVGWRPFTNYQKIQLGISGYMYTQWQDDKEYGDKVSGERGRVFGVGPQVVWNFIDHGGLVFKWQHETHVRNRPKGNRYWIEFAAPIST